MFKKSHFHIRESSSYPPFQQVVQSWYSPLLLNDTREDEGLSACVTLGVTQERPKSQEKREVILISCVNGPIPDILTLKKHIKCLSHDYLNKSTTPSVSTRTPDTVLVEAKYHDRNRILAELKLESPTYFYSDIHGGGSLEGNLNLGMPYICQVQLTCVPDKEDLRPDDGELLALLLSYPAPQSYAMLSALAQAVLYLKNRQIFETTPTYKKAYSPPKGGFYGAR